MVLQLRKPQFEIRHENLKSHTWGWYLLWPQFCQIQYHFWSNIQLLLIVGVTDALINPCGDATGRGFFIC